MAHIPKVEVVAKATSVLNHAQFLDENSRELRKLSNQLDAILKPLDVRTRGGGEARGAEQRRAAKEKASAPPPEKAAKKPKAEAEAE